MAVLESHLGYYLWNYLPSQPAAGIFAAFFLLATAAHCWKIYTQGTKFCIVFAVGCFCKCMPPSPEAPRMSINQNKTQTNSLLLCHSRIHRLLRPLFRLQQNRQTNAVHHPKLLHPRRARPLRSVHLHDPRPHHARRERRGSLTRQSGQADQDVHDGRRDKLHDPGRQRGPYVSEQHDEDRRGYGGCGLVYSGDYVWAFCDYGDAFPGMW